MMHVNERQMKQMMKKMGMQTKDIEAEEVYIKGISKDYKISNPKITVVEVQGQKVLQIIGDMKEIDKEKPVYNEEDLNIVISQTNVSKEEAIEALKSTNGSPAEAIIYIMNKHGSN